MSARGGGPPARPGQSLEASLGVGGDPPTRSAPSPPPVLYGVLFEKNKEAAFANYRLWEALGFVTAFGYSTFLCVSVKLYILLAALCLAMAAYGVVQYLESQSPAGPPAGEGTKPAEGAAAQTTL